MSLIKIMNQHLSKPQKAYKSKPSFKPSALGSPCLRKIYYSYNRVPEDYQASIQLKEYGEGGNYAGDKLAEYLRAAGALIDYVDEKGETPIRFGKPNHEFPVYSEDLNIKLALIDAVVIIDGKLWLGEFKTISKSPFDKLRIPKPDHFTQITLYYYLFNKLLKDGAYKHIKELDGFEKAEGIIILYECRDNFNKKEFIVTNFGDTFESIVKKIFEVKSHCDSGTLPGKTEDWCRSCSWRDKCAKNFKV